MIFRPLKMILTIHIILLGISIPLVIADQGRKIPYTLEQLEGLIKYRDYSEDEIVDLLGKNGINFYPDTKTIRILRDAGATHKETEAVLKANRPPQRLHFSIFSMGFFKPVKGLPDKEYFWSGTRGSIGRSFGFFLEYRYSPGFSFLFDIEHIDGEYWPKGEGGGVGDYDLWIYCPGIRLTADAHRRAALVSLFPRVYFTLSGGLYDVSYYPSKSESKEWKKYGASAGIGITPLKMRLSRQLGFSLDIWGKYHHFGESEEYFIRQGISANGALSVDIDDVVLLVKSAF